MLKSDWTPWWIGFLKRCVYSVHLVRCIFCKGIFSLQYIWSCRRRISVCGGGGCSSLSHPWLSVTPRTAAPGFPSFTISRNLLTLKFIESVMPANRLILCHVRLILCHPLLFLPSVFPSIGVFSNELVLRIRWRGTHANNLSESWEPARNVDCRAPPRTPGSETLGELPAACG